MEEVWNVRNLDPPPVNTCTATAKEIDVRLISIALKEAVEFFQSQQHLCTEAALLSRTVYRLKMKFRSSKDFKALEKLSRVLRTYLHIHMSTILNVLLRTMPKDYKINKSKIFTKNMLDFVLVRLQGLGKLLCRILETCKEVSYLTGQRFRLGHFWKLAMIAYAITARVFVITRSILKYSCKLYQELIAFLPNLKNTGMHWLPKSYVFPDRLDEWLGVDWLDLDATVIKIPDDDQSGLGYYDLIDDSDDDVEICDEYVLINDSTVTSDQVELDENDQKPELPNTDDGNKKEHNDDDIISLNDEETNNEVVDVDEVDVGEVIDISETNSCKKTAKKGKKRKRIIHTESQVINISTIETPKPLKKKLKRENTTNASDIKTPKTLKRKQKRQSGGLVKINNKKMKLNNGRT